MSTRRLGHTRGTALGKDSYSLRSQFEVTRADESPTVSYVPGERCWRLWWPCDACDGVELPLRDRASVDGSNGIALPPTPAIDDLPCPGCETRRQRLEPAGADPAVWYDALLRDWVVRLPFGGLRAGILLPLEIRWFDARWAEVCRAAGDIAFADDAFDDVDE